MKSGPWLTALPIAALTALPVVVIAVTLAHPDPAIWDHLREVVLPELMVNTACLVLGVGMGVTLLGTSLAWLTAACEFPGRRFFSWALLLPLALPAYVTAFVWIGLLDITGTVPTWLRSQGLLTSLAGWPPIRSAGGVSLVMTLALYPYVYLTARAAFQAQGRDLIEAAQSLGLSPRQAFFKVALPMARPGIIAGLSLATMETLADFGTVSVFNYDTFTTAIYQAWFSLFSLPSAALLATILVGFVFTLVILDEFARHRRGGTGVTSVCSTAVIRRARLTGRRAWFATTACGLTLLIAFVIPFVQLLVWARNAMATDLDLRYVDFAVHSLTLSLTGAALVTVLALWLGYARREVPGPGMALTTRVAGLGYALPGAVLAVGFFIPVAWLDGFMIEHWRALTGVTIGPLLGGSLVVMLLAYCARFLAVSLGPVETGLGRITRSLDEAAAVLGITGRQRLWRVHLPMLRAPLLIALALSFVDIMKELPITLMTRPFGWDTLATRVFEMTSEGEWERAALPAVAICVAGLIPVFLLIRHSDART